MLSCHFSRDVTWSDFSTWKKKLITALCSTGERILRTAAILNYFSVSCMVLMLLNFWESVDNTLMNITLKNYACITIKSKLMTKVSLIIASSWYVYLWNFHTHFAKNLDVIQKIWCDFWTQHPKINPNICKILKQQNFFFEMQTSVIVY